MKVSGYWICYAQQLFPKYYRRKLKETDQGIRLLNLLCFFVDFFPRSYLFTDLLVLHQVTELVMHLSFPNYQNWKLTVLGHFFEISSLNEKYECIRLLNLLCYFAEIVLLSSQLFVHSFVSFASSYWTCYAFEYTKLSKLKFKCFGSFLQNFNFKWKKWKYRVTGSVMLNNSFLNIIAES